MEKKTLKALTSGSVKQLTLPDSLELLLCVAKQPARTPIGPCKCDRSVDADVPPGIPRLCKRHIARHLHFQPCLKADILT